MYSEENLLSSLKLNVKSVIVAVMAVDGLLAGKKKKKEKGNRLRLVSAVLRPTGSHSIKSEGSIFFMHALIVVHRLA